MFKINSLWPGMFIFALVLTGACGHNPANSTKSSEADILTIYPDGSMTLMGKPVPVKDVLIYADGNGGEQAAVKLRIEPLHPDFYRGNIIVNRIKPEVSGTGVID